MVLGWGCPSLLSRGPLYIVIVELCSQDSKASRIVNSFREFAPAALTEISNLRKNLQTALMSTKTTCEFTTTVGRLLDVKLADHIQELTAAINEGKVSDFEKTQLMKLKKEVDQMIKTASHARAHV